MSSKKLQSFALFAVILLIAAIGAGEMLHKNSVLHSLYASIALTNEPSLRVLGPAEVDFGDQPQRAKLTHTFRLRNDSKSSIQIYEFRTSCRCVATPPKSASELVLAAGECLDVPITFTTGDQQSSATGTLFLFHRRLSDAAGADKIRPLELRLTAKVTAPYVIFPEAIDFGVVSSFSPPDQVRNIEVRGLHGLPPKITEVKTSSDRLTAELIPAGPGVHHVSVAVKLNTQGRTLSCDIHESVTLLLDSETAPRATVQVKAAYRQNAEPTPSAITVDSSVTGDAVKRFRINSICKTDVLHLTSTDVAHIRPRIVETRDDGTVDCEVELSDTAPVPLTGQIQLTLRLMPQDGAAVSESLSIPVYRFTRMHENDN